MSEYTRLQIIYWIFDVSVVHLTYKCMVNDFKTIFIYYVPKGKLNTSKECTAACLSFSILSLIYLFSYFFQFEAGL